MTSPLLFPVTGHMIVKNEDRFIALAIKSVLPFLESLIIYDTGSTDQTREILNKLKTQYSKLQVKQLSILRPQQITELRKQQIDETKTPWFLLVDGDEIWSEKELKFLLQLTKLVSKKTLAVVNRTRNCVGDIWHYLPDELGQYQLLGKTGHLNIRLMRTLPYQVKGQYPNEGYYWQGKLVNSQDQWLEFSEAWYLHLTHLKRSSSGLKPYGRRQPMYSLGIELKSEEVPEVIRPMKHQSIVQRRSWNFLLKAIGYDMVRGIRKIL